MPGKYIWDGILLGLSDAKDALGWGVGGATLLGAQTIIANLTLLGGTIAIGSVLAPIAVTAGFVCLGFAGVKGYNPIRIGIKTAKENRLKEIQHKVDKLLDKSTDFEAVISKILNDYREKVYELAVKNRDSNMLVKFQNYEDCKETREKLETLKENLNDKIS